MAYQKKAKSGPKIQQWQEEMNKEFNSTLLPTPLIRIEGTKMIESRIISEGQIGLEKIKFTVKQGLFMTPLDIHVERFNAGIGMNFQCKWPECTKNREATNNTRDSLYLCEFHRRRMANNFTKLCANNMVFINGGYSPGDYEGYVALIGLFESALRRTRAVYQGAEGEEVKMLQDLLLNVRNFLIIVKSVIKPDEDLLSSFLPHIMGVALEIVKTHHQFPIANLVSLMQFLFEHIFFSFGIMSPWDSHSYPEGTPYRQIGMGVGGMFGMAGLLFGGTPGMVAMAVGGLVGAAFGNKVYMDKRRREMLDESYWRYLIFRSIQKKYQDDEDDTPHNLMLLTGSTYGDTVLAVILIVQVLLILMAL